MHVNESARNEQGGSPGGNESIRCKSNEEAKRRGRSTTNEAQESAATEHLGRQTSVSVRTNHRSVHIFCLQQPHLLLFSHPNCCSAVLISSSMFNQAASASAASAASSATAKPLIIKEVGGSGRKEWACEKVRGGWREGVRSELMSSGAVVADAAAAARAVVGGRVASGAVEGGGGRDDDGGWSRDTC